MKIKKTLEMQNDCQKIKFKVKLPVLGSIKNRQRNEKYEKTDQCRRFPHPNNASSRNKEERKERKL